LRKYLTGYLRTIWPGHGHINQHQINPLPRLQRTGTGRNRIAKPLQDLLD